MDDGVKGRVGDDGLVEGSQMLATGLCGSLAWRRLTSWLCNVLNDGEVQLATSIGVVRPDSRSFVLRSYGCHDGISTLQQHIKNV